MGAPAFEIQRPVGLLCSRNAALLQLQDVDNQVHGVHRVRKLKGEQVRCSLGNDSIWSEELLLEFLGGVH